MKTNLTDYERRRARRDRGLEQSGIGPDVDQRLGRGLVEIGAFAAEVETSIMSQLTYDLLVNVPCGVVPLAEATAHGAIVRGLPGALGHFCQHDIHAARHLAAAILEDVNDHHGAAMLHELAAANDPDNG